MSGGTISGAGARALRDFGLALRTPAFRVALALSVLVHLVLLLVLAQRGRGPDKRVPLMRVHLLRQASSPAGAPASPVLQAAPREAGGRAAGSPPAR